MKHTLRWRVAQHFEQYWWRRYLHKKDWPTYYQWKCGYWNNLLAQTYSLAPAVQAEMAKPQRILDAGCGPAGIYMVLGAHAVTAVDPLLDIYAKWLDNFNTSRYPWADFRNLPLEQFRTREPYPIVFCMNALNHVADIGRATERLAQATEKNGWVVTTLDVHRSAAMKSLFRLVPGDILHPHQYTLQGYLQLFNGYGLQHQGNLTLRSGRLFNHELVVLRKI